MAGFDDYCTDSCGWIAALVAALSYGSFGVPIKATAHIEVWPLVYQSYKTIVMFVTCWGVQFLGVEIAFTKWGLLSGMLWVLGGTSGVAAIRLAGLSVAVGTWASVMVMVNFTFGILIFREPVADILGTLGAFLLLIVGLVGMSHFSAPQKKSHDDHVARLELEQQIPSDSNYPQESTDYQSMQDHSSIRKRTVEGEVVGADHSNFSETGNIPLVPLGGSPDDEQMIVGGDANGPEGIIPTFDDEATQPYLKLFSGRLSLTKRQCGIVAAVMNGFLTGGSLIPLHYAKEEGFGGAKYFPSMACGALLSNSLIWILYFIVRLVTDNRQGRTVHDTLNDMPPWHFRDLCLPASLSGLLLSIAMFSSIIAVTYLGQGVGNSLVQTKILVSGLWGIFFYKEIVGAATIAKWFGSAAVTVLAIIWLSLERLEASDGGGGGH